jgi:hypothetical protein
MTTNNQSPARRSLKVTAVCLAYTIAGYGIAFGLSYLGGNTYAKILVQDGGFFGADQTSHDVFVCSGAIVGCLIGGFVTVSHTRSSIPE